MRSLVRSGFVTAAAIAATMLGGMAAVAGSAPGGTQAAAGARGPMTAVAAGHRVPVFAYYYMWMTGSYWSRHKLDHPAWPFPGDYRSDSPAVIKWQVRQAKATGITGFIVSWKDTPAYRRILPLVERAARAGGLRLAMEYEGLNASRQPLPVAKVAADFRFFTSRYAPSPVWYRISGRPLTMWAGTQQFSRAAVASVTAPVRSKILVLSSGNNVAEFDRLAALTDGDAYYWSSVDPARDRDYAAKLAAMGAAVHRQHKIWIAPFAPGFNATLIGGHRIIPRDNGATLRAEYATAARSAPDILGLISWNEWTENTYMEPSIHFGFSYPKFLKGLVHLG
jgi:Glycosyl hydrolase family 99